MTLFLRHTAQEFADSFCLMLLDGAGWQHAQDLVLPDNLRLLFPPPYSPELNPVEHVWEHLRENHFGNDTPPWRPSANASRRACAASAGSPIWSAPLRASIGSILYGCRQISMKEPVGLLNRIHTSRPRIHEFPVLLTVRCPTGSAVGFSCRLICRGR